MRYRVMLLGLVAPALLAAQPFGSRDGIVALAQDRQAEQPQPRFRAGANLVRVDAYVSKGDAALTDLTAGDFQVFEDDKPQTIESFELVRARAPLPETERRAVTNTRDMRQQIAGATRVFTLFFDPLYVSLSGSYHLQTPLVDTLDQVIGPDDMIGAMTPDLSPSAITYSQRTGSIEQFVTKHWTWGQRDQRNASTPEEDAIANCYDPDDPKERGLAEEMIARIREKKTLGALHSLVLHLDTLRPERKFVLVFTEGWPLFGVNKGLSRTIDSPGPMPDPITVDPGTGRIRPQGSPDPKTGAGMTTSTCERLRMQLSLEDHALRTALHGGAQFCFRQLSVLSDQCPRLLQHHLEVGPVLPVGVVLQRLEPLARWRGKVTEERIRFVKDCRSGVYEMKEFYERYGISRKTGYKWLDRFEAEGASGMKDRSRAPLQCRHRMADDVR